MRLRILSVVMAGLFLPVSTWPIHATDTSVTPKASANTATTNDDWPQFRGPNGDGHVLSGPLPTSWSESENIAWKTAVPGKGYSSPVIAGGQVWMTTAVTAPLSDEEKKSRLEGQRNPHELNIVGDLSLRAVCIDVDSGEVVHNIELFNPEQPGPIHLTNSYASPTPVLRDGRLYCHFGTYGSACVDMATGDVVWRSTELQTDHQNGPGSSPILWRNLLITHYDGIDTQSLAAVDVSNGETVWRTTRTGEMDPRETHRKAYATPVIVETSDGPELVSPAADWVYGYDPASGKELWKASYGKLGFSTVPRPVVGHGLAYVCTSFPKSRLVAVRYDGEGDVSESHIAWTSDSQIPKKPSLLLAGNELYVVSDGGILTCLDAKTGDEVWRERLGGNYSASPILSGKHLYVSSLEGVTTIVETGRTFKQLAVNKLDAAFNASPAASGGSLFLRSQTHLYRIGQTAH